MLLHIKTIENTIDFDSALYLIMEDIQNGEVMANDKELKAKLKDTQVTTAGFLLKFIVSGY